MSSLRSSLRSSFRGTILAAALIASCVSHASSQEVSDSISVESETDVRIHDELRALRERMFAAYNQRDLDALLEDCTEDIVITWQNGERNLGHEEFRAFYNKMMNGDNAIVKDIATTFEVDGSSLLYGEKTAVARGTVNDRFTLANGSEFLLNSNWTATVVQQDNSWKVASFHVSASIFDNPILDKATNSLFLIGSLGALCGVVVGVLGMRLLCKRAS